MRIRKRKQFNKFSNLDKFQLSAKGSREAASVELNSMYLFLQLIQYIHTVRQCIDPGIATVFQARLDGSTISEERNFIKQIKR